VTKRALTICAIGVADSPHVAARTRCFAELGHRVYLITESRSANGIEGVTEVVPELAKNGPLAFFLRVLHRLLALAGLRVDHLSRAVAFIALLRRYRPDVVHVHFAYSYYAWMAGMVGCRPLAVTVMGGDVLFDEQGAPTAEGKWLTLNLLRQADYITAKSDYLISVLERLGGFGRKAERIVWGISLAHFRRGFFSECHRDDPQRIDTFTQQLEIYLNEFACLACPCAGPNYSVLIETHIDSVDAAFSRGVFPSFEEGWPRRSSNVTLP